jgi:hypothetical protein
MSNNIQIILMNNEKKLLNRLLRKKSELYLESSFSNQNDQTLINLLLNWTTNNYPFTDIQIQRFFTQAFYYPPRKNLRRLQNIFASSNNSTHLLIINHILVNYNITDAQIKTILTCHFDVKKIYYWINILFSKKYKFTIDDLVKLHEENYIPEIRNYDSLHNNVIFAVCEYITRFNKNVKEFKRCIDIIAQNTNIEPFDIEHFEIILKCLGSSPNENIHDPTNITLLFDTLFQHYNDKNVILQMVIDSKISNIVLNRIIDKFGYNDAFIKYFFKNISRFNPELILKLIDNGFQITVEHINLLLNLYNKNTDVSFCLRPIDEYKLLGPHYKLLTNNKLKCIEIPMIDLFEICKISPNIDTLNIICKQSSPNIVYYFIDILLKKYKLIPDETTLNTCILTLDTELTEKILKYKLTPSNRIVFEIDKLRDHSLIIDMLELLIANGLIVNNDDIQYLLNNGIFLNNLERFNVNYDEDLYYMYYLHGYRPSTTEKAKFTISNIILQMHQMCKTKVKYFKLITFLKNNNINLDRFSLEFLLLHNYNVYYSLCTNHKEYVPSVLSAFAKINYVGYKNNMSIYDVAKKYNITAKDMFEQYNVTL